MMQLDNIMQLDILLPSQHFGRRRSHTPEHRLMMAVLHDAIHCLEKYRSAESSSDRRILRETQEWFRSAETDWPYSFECICAVLDLDAEAVRQRMQLTMPETQLVLVSRPAVRATREPSDDDKEEPCEKSRRTGRAT